tara:strand:+ start:1587 stop:1769 length:183 start_codon:yes stop_codon:yes gene_type:complete
MKKFNVEQKDIEEYTKKCRKAKLSYEDIIEYMLIWKQEANYWKFMCKLEQLRNKEKQEDS